jgi:hypothetical protein
MKTILIAFVFIATLSLSEEYKTLKEYKQNFHNVSNKSPNRDTAPTEIEKKYKNFIEISYYDINEMDTDLLEKKYGLDLWLCIGDGICIFKAKKEKNCEIIIERIKKEEPAINSVKKYFRYEFKPF